MICICAPFSAGWPTIPCFYLSHSPGVRSVFGITSHENDARQIAGGRWPVGGGCLPLASPTDSPCLSTIRAHSSQRPDEVCFTADRGITGRERGDCYGPAADTSALREFPYSITSSACAISVAGTVRPSALAVLRLMTNSNLVGCWTGKSEGLAPLRILSTYVAVCRDKSGRFAP
jgi:hypothetical protein